MFMYDKRVFSFFGTIVHLIPVKMNHFFVLCYLYNDIFDVFVLMYAYFLSVLGKCGVTYVHIISTVSTYKGKKRKRSMNVSHYKQRKQIYKSDKNFDKVQNYNNISNICL
jgi:hypothetical protein